MVARAGTTPTSADVSIASKNADLLSSVGDDENSSSAACGSCFHSSGPRDVQDVCECVVMQLLTHLQF